MVLSNFYALTAHSAWCSPDGRSCARTGRCEPVCVTVVLQWCYRGVTIMLEWCYQLIELGGEGHVHGEIHLQSNGHGVTACCRVTVMVLQHVG
jgi:hypothetical protein